MEKRGLTPWEFIKLLPQLIVIWSVGCVLTLSDIFVHIFRRRAHN